MHETDKYEAKVLMHRIRFERGDESQPRSCTECGGRTTRDSGPCTACLCKRLSAYIGGRSVAKWLAAVKKLEDAEQHINELLEH